MKNKIFCLFLFFITLYTCFMFFSVHSFAAETLDWSSVPLSYNGIPLTVAFYNPIGQKYYGVYTNGSYTYDPNYYPNDIYSALLKTNAPTYVYQYVGNSYKFTDYLDAPYYYAISGRPDQFVFKNSVSFDSSLPDLKVTASFLTFSKNPFSSLALISITDHLTNHYDYYDITVSGSKKTQTFSPNFMQYGVYLSLEEFCNYGEVVVWKVTPYKGFKYGMSYVGILDTNKSSLTKFSGTPVVPSVSTQNGQTIDVVGEDTGNTYIVQSNSKTDFSFTENNLYSTYNYYVLNTTTNVTNNNVTYEIINNIVNNTENITNNNQQYITNYYITYNYNYGYGGGTGGSGDPDNPFGEIDIGSFLRNFKSTFDSSFADLVDRTNFLLSIGVHPRLVNAFISLFAFIVVAIIIGIVLTLFGR